jgi:hypothetical protein
MRAILAMTIALTIVIACGEDRPPCYRGDYIGCWCENGAYGYQACTEAQDGYGACVCNGRIPGLDASAGDADATADASDAAKLPLFAPCTDSAQCEDAVCFAYGDGRSLCSKNCTVATQATDCPPPATGCNGKGACKPP